MKQILPLLLLFIASFAFSHPMPNAVLLLSLKEKNVAAELQLPLSQLELAFGKSLNEKANILIDSFDTQLKSYVLSHWKIKSENNQNWTINIEKMQVDSVIESASGAYKELIINLLLTPPLGESNRVFTMEFDVITHQVVTHSTLVIIRQDWETGISAEHPSEIGVIETDIVSNTIFPFKINQGEASIWKGFKSMIQLGMKHIAEGIDHLLFLLVLLFPSPLLVENKRWTSFGGVKFSLLRLFKIVTAFTIGHSITLLLGALGWIHLPSQWIEIAIALSILVSAFHAISPLFYGKEMYIAGGFGLIHGMAFSNTLTNLDLSSKQLALSILGFNVGIELMQLLIIIIVMPFLLFLSKKEHFYKYFRIIGAVLASIAALGWVVERVTMSPNIVTIFIEKWN
jgi:hypothetical protein